jgi:hypothetical protein
MSAGAPARLQIVTPPERGREIPQDVLRFAGLDPERRSILLRVGELLDDIAFGTVVIVQQDGTVIQIETSEKIRLR